MKKTILLTGASGFLGANFCHFYADEYQITAIYNQHPVSFKNVKSIRLDLNNAAEVELLIAREKFDFVLHLAASSDPNFCELNPEITHLNNVRTTMNLADICAALKIHLLFASTDLVFNGQDPPYKESDSKNPVNWYGLQKSAAENYVLYTNPPQNIVTRLPLMYGNSYSSGKSFIQPILQKLQNSEPVFLFTDEYRTVASARNICEAFHILMNSNANGIFHLGGNERLSRFEIGEKICAIYGFDKKYLKPSLQSDVKMPAKRPKDVSLQNNKMKNLGWKPGLFEDELVLLKEN